MEIQLIQVPTINDYRGNIGVIEKDVIPFEIKRVYYLFDVPSSASRGGHAHKEQAALLVPLSGSFDVVLHDGKNAPNHYAQQTRQRAFDPKNVWRELENFSSGAVCLVISSGEFDESDYIRDFDEFLSAQ